MTQSANVPHAHPYTPGYSDALFLFWQPAVHSVEMNSNPEPKTLVLEFQNKAKTLMEKTYGVPWSQLRSMDFCDLPEPVWNPSSDAELVYIPIHVARPIWGVK